MIGKMMTGVGKRAFVGGFRGSMYGIAGGFILGAVGHVFGENMSTAKMLTWTDRDGNKKRFTDLESLEAFEIYRDLMVLFDSRECDLEAYNDSCRHIQSVVFLNKRSVDAETSGIMDANRIKDKSILATKSMNALLISCRANHYPDSDKVEESMMHIHLVFEELIHNVRKSSEDVLPEI